MKILKIIGAIAVSSSIGMFIITVTQLIGFPLNISELWYWIFQIYFMIMWVITIFIAFIKLLE